jgi:hypothetical protein
VRDDAADLASYRIVIAATAALVIALGVLLIVNGLALHQAYQAGLATCRASGSCGDLQAQLFRKEGTVVQVINLMIAAPLVIGMFLGAPLVARDLEQHTSKLIWTQAVTPRRWFLAKIGWLGLIATITSATIAALVTWWSGPLNALGRQQFWPGQFDIQGIVPAAYALFAFALGVTAGLLARRTVTALGVTVGVFVTFRELITTYLRPRYLPPTTAALPPGPHTAFAAQGNWTLGQRLSIPVSAGGGHGRVLPQQLVDTGCHASHFACLAAAEVRQVFTFQPATRFWAFQGIEAALYLALAAMLVALSMMRLRRVEG